MVSTRIEMKSALSGKRHQMDIPLTELQVLDGFTLHRNGVLIQDAFPTLTNEQREFLKTGITPEEWDATFPKEEE